MDIDASEVFTVIEKNGGSFVVRQPTLAEMSRHNGKGDIKLFLHVHVSKTYIKCKSESWGLDGLGVRVLALHAEDLSSEISQTHSSYFSHLQ